MFDLGIGEIIVIGVFALIFVGPKDFTKMFRELGRMSAKLRKMARDFQRAMEDAADETGMKETASSLKKMTSAKELGLDAVKDAAKGWDPTRYTSKSDPKPKEVGPETAKLAEERAEQTRKIREATVKKTQERLDAEKAAAAAAKPEPTAEVPATGNEAKAGDAS